MLNLINKQKDIDKIYLYARDLNESKYEYLVKNRENAGTDVYENINDYNPNRRRKILIVFDDMIADIMANKKF